MACTGGARSGPNWSEVYVNAAQAAASTVAMSFENGDSLLLLHNLMRAEELACLNVEVATALHCEREAQSSFNRFGPPPADVPMHIFRRDRVRLPLERMPASANILCDALLVRVLTLLETQLPDLAHSLFGECLPCATCISNTIFEHSRGEPAINVYTAFGSLAAHEDQHYLTVLIPLSDGDAADGEDVLRVHTAGSLDLNGKTRGTAAFTGGGTAFWSVADRGPQFFPNVLGSKGPLTHRGQETARSAVPDAQHGNGGAAKGEESYPPTFIVRPPAGTALVFGGKLTHAGHPVASGERAVFVASFSLCTEQRDLRDGD